MISAHVWKNGCGSGGTVSHLGANFRVAAMATATPQRSDDTDRPTPTAIEKNPRATCHEQNLLALTPKGLNEGARELILELAWPRANIDVERTSRRISRRISRAWPRANIDATSTLQAENEVADPQNPAVTPA